MRPLPDLLVFDRAQAKTLGWSDPALTRAVRAGRVVQVRRGLFARAGGDAERARAIAATRACAGSVLSHRSAAMMHDLPVVGSRPRMPELTVQPTGTGSAARAYLHRATLTADDVTLVDDVPVTSAARTVIDLGRSRSTACAVAAIDCALNRGLVTPDDLDRVLLRCWNWPGIRRAQRAVRSSDGRAESALESISRLVIGWLRLPAPEPQVIACNRFGYAVGRLDFYWEEFGVAGEADGAQKYSAEGVDLLDEKQRQENLEDEGMVFVRWGWTQPWQHPQLLKSRLLAGFERGLARDRSGLPRLWSISRPQASRRGENVITTGRERADAGRT